jgi:signal peptide peptidase SppA
VVDRMLDGNKVDLEVLEAYRAKTMERGERVRARDGVAILYADGPLFKKSNMMVEFSGATSYEMLRRDLQVALDDPTIHSIAFHIDSPGGEANGVDELANAIYDARDKKPITAFVSGMAASGGYWIASAASKIVVSDAALLGSIGVVLGIRDTSEADGKRGVKTLQFVSSQSPGKRPDPNTEEGANRIQTMVNDLADVFVSQVARNRGVTSETVIQKFGAGGVEVGKKAVALGMADEVGSFEAVLSSLKAGGNKGRFSKPPFGGFSMSEDNNGPTAAELAAKAATDATKAAQVRIKGILTADAAKNLGGLAAHLAYDTSMSVEDAGKILAAANGDFEVATAAASEASAGDTSGRDFVAHKQGTGAITGLGRDEPAPVAERETSAKLWGSAVDRVNTGLGFERS